LAGHSFAGFRIVCHVLEDEVDVVADEREIGREKHDIPRAPVANATKPVQKKSDAAPPTPAVAPFTAEEAQRFQEAWAEHLGVPVDYTNSLDMKFRLIPPGECVRGSSEEVLEAMPFTRNNDVHSANCVRGEAPRHRVILTKPFYMGVHEVTQRQYEEVMKVNPSYFSKNGREDTTKLVAGLETSRFPVDNVKWPLAASFCAKLAERESLAPFYGPDGATSPSSSGHGYRLPTEAEWEFACRAGTTTRFWCGSDVKSLAAVGWTKENAWATKNDGGRTHEVGKLKANPFGLHDVHGNVAEWCHDRSEPDYYQSIPEGRIEDPWGLTDARVTDHVVRGGNWYEPAPLCRSSSRETVGKKYLRWGFHLGMRVVISVDAVRIALSGQPAEAVAPFDAAEAERASAK
jgi:formylglycine-generating enzyme required for sulfatase activity